MYIAETNQDPRFCLNDQANSLIHFYKRCVSLVIWRWLITKGPNGHHGTKELFPSENTISSVLWRKKFQGITISFVCQTVILPENEVEILNLAFCIYNSFTHLICLLEHFSSYKNTKSFAPCTLSHSLACQIFWISFYSCFRFKNETKYSPVPRVLQRDIWYGLLY